MSNVDVEQMSIGAFAPSSSRHGSSPRCAGSTCRWPRSRRSWSSNRRPLRSGSRLTEPPHREAFVHVGKGDETSPAQWELVSESLRAWAEGQDWRPADLGVRLTYTWNGLGSEPTGPDNDFVVPFAAA
jgi:hypothetical protein